MYRQSKQEQKVDYNRPTINLRSSKKVKKELPNVSEISNGQMCEGLGHVSRGSEGNYKGEI